MQRKKQNKNLKIYAPENFIKADEKTKNQIINGCGSKKAKFDFVPDKILFLNIFDACAIHDWMYYTGKENSDKETADRVFF